MTTPQIKQRFRDIATPLGEKILEFADANNLSLVGIARKLKIDHHIIYSATTKPVWSPQQKTRSLLCEMLGLTGDDLTALGVVDGSPQRLPRHPCRKCGKPIHPRRTYCSQDCFDDDWQVRLPPAAFRDPLRVKVLAAINASELKVYPWAEQHGLHAQNFADWLRDPERKLFRRNLGRLTSPLGLSEDEVLTLAGGTAEEKRAEHIQSVRLPLPKLQKHLNRIRRLPRSDEVRAAISKRMKGRPQTPSRQAAIIRDSHSLSGRLRRMVVAYKVGRGHYPEGDELLRLAIRANNKYAVGNQALVQAEMGQTISRLSGAKVRRGRKTHYGHLEICARRRADETWAVIAEAVAGHATQAETVRPAHALWHSRKKIPPCLTPA